MRTIRIARSCMAVGLLGASLALAGCGSSTPPATTAQNTTHPTGEHPQAQHHRAQHGGLMMLIAMSLKDLDLSADQHAAVEKIKSDLHAKMEPVHTAGKDLSNAIADSVAAGAIDHAKVDPAVEAVGTAVEGAHSASLEGLNQLHAALKPPQRAALIDKVHEHWEHWKAAHGKDEQEDHKHHPGHLAALAKEIGLSEEQSEQIRAKFRDQMKAHPQDHEHKEVHEHVQAFGAAFKSDTFDAKALQGGNHAGARMAKWGAARMVSFLDAALPVLTADQRTKLAQIIRDRASHKPS